jgi:hypothetical protein
MSSFALVFETMSREWMHGGEGWNWGKGAGGFGRNWVVERLLLNGYLIATHYSFHNFTYCIILYVIFISAG